MITSGFVLLGSALVAVASPLLESRATCADGTVLSNAACCKWVGIRNQLIDLFEGECGEDAHSTVRIAFHDAAGFSKTKPEFGNGADGSIIHFINELTFADNAGIDDIVDILKPFADSVKISYGDVIQFGSSVALSLCAGAPRVQTFVGRPNATQQAVDGTIPGPSLGVTTILNRMNDMGFSNDEFVALLASHSVAAQDKVDESIPGAPFDSTPDSFDPQIFLETLLVGSKDQGQKGLASGEVLSPLPGEFRLQSDQAIARDSRTACTWQSFVTNQALQAQKFSAAMTKLSLLGQNKAILTDCTEVIPIAPPALRGQAFFPAGTNRNMIQGSCATAAFPSTLSTQAGPMSTVAPVG